MKKVKWLIVLMVSLLLAGCGNGSEKTGETINEVEQNNALEKEATSNASIDVYGEVVAHAIKEIYIDFPATIEEIYVKDGDSLKSGDRILKLNYSSYTHAIANKEQALELLKIRQRELERNVDPTIIEINKIKNELALKENFLEGETDPDIKMLKEQAQVAESNLSKAQKDYEVYESLLQVDGMSKNEVEEAALILRNKEKIRNDALATLEKTKTDKALEVEALTASLKVKEAQVSNTSSGNQSSLEEVMVQIKMAQLEMMDMQEKLNKSYLKGENLIADEEESIVYDISVKQGTMVGQEATVILRMIDKKSLIAVVDIPEEFMSQIQIGSKAEVVFYADKSKVLEGKISRIANKAVEEKGETIVKADITLTGDTSFIKPGYAVDVKLYTIN